MAGATPPRGLRLLRRLGRFSWRVLRAFGRNRGILLAGGVGYNGLLSLLPFLALTAAGLSLFVDEQRLMRTITAELRVFVPQHADAVVRSIESFLAQRHVVGVVGALALVFFSSLAFRMLQEAIALIFDEPAPRARRRHPWIEWLLPYAYLAALGAALVGVTLAALGFDAIGDRTVALLGVELSAATTGKLLLRLVAFVALVALFTSIYKLVPARRVSLRRAAAGGLAAALLWLATERALAYYFVNFSLVSVVYGPLATVVVILVFFEVAAIILLLGAQVIAELERSAAAGLRWFEEP